MKEEPIAEEESILPNDFEDANDWQEVLPESHSDEEWKPSRNTEKHKWRICGVSQKRNRQRVARKRKRAKVDKLLGSPVKSDLIQVSQENPVLGFSRKEFQQVLDKDYEISTGSKTSHLSLRNWQCSSCSEDGISSMTLPEFMDHYLYHISNCLAFKIYMYNALLCKNYLLNFVNLFCCRISLQVFQV